MKILVLCSPRFDSGTVEERFWPVDRHIISELKKTDEQVNAQLFDKNKILELSNFELVFNLCDGF